VRPQAKILDERELHMRVLVTGGAGFIGGNLVHVLINSGMDVGVIDDFSTGSMANIHPAAWLRSMDILDPGLDAAVADFAPDAVVHLAAQAYVTASIVDPDRDRAVNVDGTVAVARAAAAAGARRVLSASSAAVYGVPGSLPIREGDPKRPANPYGVSKLAAESALAEALVGTGVDFACMRFSNVYGPRQDGRGEGGVVAIFALRLVAGEKPIIYGDGRQTRDFIFVGDVVAFICEALEFEGALARSGPDGPAYNVSTGQPTSVLQIAAYLSAASHVLKNPEYREAREGDIAESVLDPGKALATIGWTAGQALENGVAFTWRWMCANQT
jgi:UDP-glucose 4-epimerase